MSWPGFTSRKQAQSGIRPAVVVPASAIRDNSVFLALNGRAVRRGAREWNTWRHGLPDGCGTQHEGKRLLCLECREWQVGLA